MVLRNPIAAHNIISDPAITHFNNEAQKRKPDLQQLNRDQELYRQFLLAELFTFNGLKKRSNLFKELLPDLSAEIVDVADKFIRQLTTFDAQRIQKAALYFYEKLKTAAESLHRQLPGMIGQSKEKAAKADHLLQWIMMRISLMEHFAKESFTSADYLELKKKARAESSTDQSRSYLKALNAKPNEELFNQFMSWRDTEAEKSGIMPNMVLSENTMATIAEKLPPTLKALGGVKGVGQQKATQYGQELIAMIRFYQQELQGPGTEQVSMF
jgi:superfamily II DNA helicase RecQ